MHAVAIHTMHVIDFRIDELGVSASAHDLASRSIGLIPGDWILSTGSIRQNRSPVPRRRLLRTIGRENVCSTDTESDH